MRLLVVVDYFDDPPAIGSAVIAYHWARILARRHQVDLLCTEHDWQPRWDRFLARHGMGRPPVRAHRRTRLRQALAPLWGLPPATVRVDAQRLVDDLRSRGAVYDAAIVVAPSQLRVAERLRTLCPVIFVPYDSVPLVARSRRGRRASALERAREIVETPLWARIERQRYPGLDAVVFVANADAAEASRGWTGDERRRLSVIPNGVDAEYFHPEVAADGRFDLVFTGNLWTAESMMAAEWFVGEVLPGIRRLRAGATLLLAGRSPHAALVRLAAADRGIQLRPDVPDIRPHIAAGDVYVCPMVSGSGVKNRLLEAMSMGRAIVATGSCASALSLRPGEEVAVADDADAFAGAVARLLQEREERQRLGSAARQAVLGRFSWEAAVANVEEILAGV
jgi:polysaccharide biosynthesis protein PslH